MSAKQSQRPPPPTSPPPGHVAAKRAEPPPDAIEFPYLPRAKGTPPKAGTKAPPGFERQECQGSKALLDPLPGLTTDANRSLTLPSQLPPPPPTPLFADMLIQQNFSQPHAPPPSDPPPSSSVASKVLKDESTPLIQKEEDSKFGKLLSPPTKPPPPPRISPSAEPTKLADSVTQTNATNSAVQLFQKMKSADLIVSDASANDGSHHIQPRMARKPNQLAHSFRVLHSPASVAKLPSAPPPPVPKPPVSVPIGVPRCLPTKTLSNNKSATSPSEITLRKHARVYKCQRRKNGRRKFRKRTFVSLKAITNLFLVTKIKPGA